jgi:DNA/RNA-binding domain of Phe-tRNA-synthetase-like protein
MYLNVAPELLELGLASSVLVARGVDNTRSTPEFLAYRRQVGKRLAAHWRNRSISAHPAIREYHRVHELFGVADEPPAPEKLVLYVRRNQDLTNSGPIVDGYNLVSAKTLLSIGAHDLRKLATPITLRKCDADDVFIPLGQSERQSVAGEFGYVDPDKRVICRLDVLQGDHSKTTRESRDVVFFLQANRCLSSAALLKGTWYLAEIIERFTGGKAEIVGFVDAGGIRTVGSSKPFVSFNEFKGLNLRKATVVRAEPIPEVPALSIVTARAEAEELALAPTAALPGQIAGQQVIIATGLSPISVGRRSLSAYLMTVSGDSAATAVKVESDIPDGLKLY